MTVYTQHLIEAAERGDHVEVARLIPLSHPSAQNNAALKASAKGGHIECVRVLLAACDTSGGINEIVYSAAFGGHVDCLRLLLPYGVEKCNDHALIKAANGGSVEAVQFLLAHADPKFLDSRALRGTVRYGYDDCIDVLLPVSDAHTVIREIETYDAEMAAELRARYEKLVLNKVIGDTQNVEATKRKM